MSDHKKGAADYMGQDLQEPEALRKISSVTPTLCALLGVESPRTSDKIPLKNVMDNARTESVNIVKKVLVFAPDALGRHLRQKYDEYFQQVLLHAPLEISLSAVMPTLTPVNCASMFTGASPQVHGIQAYEKPVLSCDTLFDTLVQAGRKAAIVAVKNSSIDLIFRNRRVDYFSENYDAEVAARALSLLETDGYDFILAYQQEYDDILHESTPYSGSAVRAMKNHIGAFVEIARAFDYCWGRYNRVILFAPDHGAHLDPVTGKGSHGTDREEDLLIQHFWGIRKGGR
jgi:hypothetical protein